MIEKLEPHQYAKVLDIIHSDYIGVEPQTVITGANPGFICSDSPESPRTAMVFHQGEGGVFFMGDPHNKSFLSQVKDYIFGDLKKELASRGIEDFEFSGDSEQWTPVFREVFSDCHMEESDQTIYSLKREFSPGQQNLSSVYSLKKIDRELLSDSSLMNNNSLLETINLWWKTDENFLEKSYGVVAMKDDEIVGRCLIDGSYASLSAMGIATEEGHRGKGIATAMGKKLIEEILKSGHKPYWECMDTNLASKKTAEKCGLSYDFSYRLFYFSL